MIRWNAGTQLETPTPCNQPILKHQLIDKLDHPTWTELAYEVAVKASTEQGLTEAKAGDLVSQDYIEKEFGIR